MTWEEFKQRIKNLLQSTFCTLVLDNNGELTIKLLDSSQIIQVRSGDEYEDIAPQIKRFPMDSAEDAKVINTILSYVLTPIDKREISVKQYYLKVLSADQNAKQFYFHDPLYVSGINQSMTLGGGSLEFELGEANTFSENELTRLENVYPVFKSSIEAMKEEVKDDGQ